jgi:very-short-patch-repair endonuclease
MTTPNPPAPFPLREGGEDSRPKPPARNVVRGQAVDEAKVLRAKQLRREMTPAEARLWERLRRNQLEGLHFRRQQVIDGFIADFYCHSAGVVVEVDGVIHDAQTEYDAERDRIFARRRLRTLRVRNDEVNHDIEKVLRRVASACRTIPSDEPVTNNRPTVFLPSPFRGGAGGGVSA